MIVYVNLGICQRNSCSSPQKLHSIAESEDDLMRTTTSPVIAVRSCTPPPPRDKTLSQPFPFYQVEYDLEQAAGLQHRNHAIIVFWMKKRTDALPTSSHHSCQLCWTGAKHEAGARHCHRAGLGQMHWCRSAGQQQMFSPGTATGFSNFPWLLRDRSHRRDGGSSSLPVTF